MINAVSLQRIATVAVQRFHGRDGAILVLNNSTPRKNPASASRATENPAFIHGHPSPTDVSSLILSCHLPARDTGDVCFFLLDHIHLPRVCSMLYRCLALRPSQFSGFVDETV